MHGPLLRAQRQGDRTFGRRVLGRVRQQVRHHLLEPRRVGVEPSGPDVHGEHVLPEAAGQAKRLDGSPDQLRQLDAACLERELSRARASDVLQVVHQLGHVPGLSLDHPAGAGGHLALAARPVEHLDRRADGPQWIPQLMPEHGEELILPPVGLLGGAVCTLQGLARAFTLLAGCPQGAFQRRDLAHHDRLGDRFAPGQLAQRLRHPAPGRHGEHEPEQQRQGPRCRDRQERGGLGARQRGRGHVGACRPAGAAGVDAASVAERRQREHAGQGAALAAQATRRRRLPRAGGARCGRAPGGARPPARCGP